MGFHRRSAAVLAALALAASCLAGCAGARSGEGAPAGCVPSLPRLSADVVRPGDTVTVSISAATCRPRFDDDRRLELTWVDHARHRTPLPTVRAFPSGAFEREIRIPASAPAGAGRVVVEGVEVPCPPNASCGAYEVGVQVVDTAPDFSRGHENQVAAGIAERLVSSIGRRPSFVEPAIVPDGVEVFVHTRSIDAETTIVRRAFVAAQEAAPAGDRTVARAARLHVRLLQHGRRELDRLTTRIAEDDAWWKRHRLELSGWGPDLFTDSVRISVRHYSDETAVLLIRRYGAAVSVSTRDTAFGVAL